MTAGGLALPAVQTKKGGKGPVKIIDMHCDTLMHAALAGELRADLLRQPERMVDLERMERGGLMAQFFAIFVVPREEYRRRGFSRPLTDQEYIHRCEAVFAHNMQLHSDIIAAAKSAGDIRANAEQGKMSGVLTIEDGGFVQGSLEGIRQVYEEGVRVFGLTWNFKNCLASPNSADPQAMGEGLTPFGKEAVEYMNQLGMGIDVSHLSDGGFYDVARISRKPFFATHSNCRALCPHPRNLTDEMIRVLADKGGVMGLNFAPQFLDTDPDAPRSTVEAMVRMVLHMYKTGGEEVIGLGADLDGISGSLELSDCSMFDRLWAALGQAGFSERQLDKFAHGNVLRVLADVE